MALVNYGCWVDFLAEQMPDYAALKKQAK